MIKTEFFLSESNIDQFWIIMTEISSLLNQKCRYCNFIQEVSIPLDLSELFSSFALKSRIFLLTNHPLQKWMEEKERNQIRLNILTEKWAQNI